MPLAPQRLSGSTQLLLDGICTRFEESWRAGQSPALKEFLHEVDTDLRSDLLRELVAVEFELRMTAGEHPAATEYLGAFPEYAAALQPLFAELALSNSAARDTSPLDSLAQTVALEPQFAPTARERLAVSEFVFPGYQVHGELGRGGMGIVLRAWDEKLHRAVAIKTLTAQLATDEACRQRFLREARASAAIRHPNVVAIHAVEENHNPPFLVLELVEGESLAERLVAGRLSLDETLRIAADLAAGLAAAHDQGIVHRDLKPGNVLIEARDGRARLTDFGLARAAWASGLTSHGAIVGTPQFMSPEQVEGRELDHRSDLFSLGAVLYVMVTGQHAFTGESLLSLARQICDRDPRPISELCDDVPAWLRQIIEQLLAKQPASRIQSADELLRRLRQADAAPAQPAPRRPRLAHRLLPAGLLLLCVGLIAFGVWQKYPRPNSDTPPVSHPERPPIPAASPIQAAAPDWNPVDRLRDSGQRLGQSDMTHAAVADMDGDGDLDLVVACGKFADPQPCELWFNDGQGRFTLHQSFGQSVSGGVAMGDVDGDDDLDVWVANWPAPNAEWGPDSLWLNDGRGNLTESPQRLDPGDGLGATLADVDNDGDLDAWVANFRQPEQLWLNNGRGQFTPSGQRFREFGTVAVAFAHLNSDRAIDAVTFGTVQPAVTWWQNDGRGQFHAAATARTEGETVKGFVADLNGDSRPDAVACTNRGLHIFLLQADGQFAAPRIVAPQLGAWQASAVDLNGDGRLDLVFVAAASRELYVVLNQGDGQFGYPRHLPNCRDVTMIVGADFDGDGDEDLYLGLGDRDRDREPDRVLFNLTKDGSVPNRKSRSGAD